MTDSKQPTLTKQQKKETYLATMLAASAAIKRGTTDEEMFLQLKHWDVETTQEEVTKMITFALNNGIFVLSRTKIPDAAGKKMLRVTGVPAVVSDGMDITALKEAKNAEMITGLANVVSIRLATALRRQENVNVDVKALAKHLYDSLSYVANNGGISKSLSELLEGSG